MEPATESSANASTIQESMFNGKTYPNRLSNILNRYEQININDLYIMIQKLEVNIHYLSLQVKDMEYRNDECINSKITRLHEKIDSLIILEPLE